MPMSPTTDTTTTQRQPQRSKMSEQRDVLDPQLSGSLEPNHHKADTAHRTLPPPPIAHPYASRSDSSKATGSTYQSPPTQPYYHYPSPRTQTPRGSTGGSNAHSTHPSPDDGYPVADDTAGSPEDGGDDDANAEDPKRPRACEACCGLKVRCDQDPAHPEIPCKRCAKAGRQCIITQPSRKRQKKSDSRVAELEKKLDALTAALQQQQGGAMGPYAAPPTGMDTMQGGNATGHSSYARYPLARPASAGEGMPTAKRRRMDDTFSGDSPHIALDGADEVNNHRLTQAGSGGDVNDPSSLSTFGNPKMDLGRYMSAQSPEEFINRINSLISPDMASTIFKRYTTQLAPHMPAVVFPPGTTAEQVFSEKPILYVCILSASAHGQLHPDITKQIAIEAVGAIADCVVRNGAKSLELIQAMQVTALWYRPPEKAEQTNFYQIIHMAAVMALDIGLGKRFNPAKARRGFGGPNAKYAPGPHRTLPQDSDTLEARRAWLGCYFLCASASMVLRRPNLVRWTNYMTECIEVLESHPDAVASDKLFCQHIKIQHICEEIGLQFLMDDNTANISITDPKVTYALNVLERQLKAWKEQIPPECRTAGLLFFEHVTSLYLHEIALHFNHNIEDFRLPFTEESLKTVNNTSDTFTANQMAALEACLKAAHGILDTILSMDMAVIKTLPMLIYFVRCTYAIVILIKMHVSVCTPNSELGKIMKSEDLKVEHYIDNLIGLFSYMAQEETLRPHPKILRILGVLRDWFEKHKETVATQQRGEQGPAEKQSEPSSDGEPVPQTPLHLLSQVATDDQQNVENRSVAAVAGGLAAPTGPQNWSFNTPFPVDYKSQHYNTTDARFPVARQPPGQGIYPSTYSLPAEDAPVLLDPGNPDYGWGSNFEQAMDMALGGMDGLPLDGWFLGDSMAPFAFNGDVPGAQVQGQWQGGTS